MDKILVVSEQWWPEGGGGTLATHLSVRSLSQSEKVRISVVSGTRRPTIASDMRFVFTPSLRVGNKVALWRNLVLNLRRDWFMRLLSSSDIVYVPRYCYPIIPVAKKLGKRVVVHLHDYQPISHTAAILHEPNGRSIPDTVEFEVLEHKSVVRAVASGLVSAINGFSRLWVAQADEVVCVSEKQKEILVKYAPELAGKAVVVRNLLPEVSVMKKTLTDPPSMLYLGGDSYIKGFQVFLRASRDFMKSGKKAGFLLTRDLSNSAKAILDGLNKRFHGGYSLLGDIRHQEVLALHPLSHALLFPSLWEEPLPYAVLEAMLGGTIPIASMVGGVPEITRGTYAESMMVPSGDANALVDKMEEVAAMSEEQLKGTGAGLRESVMKRFDANAVKDQLLNILCGR